MKKFINRLVIGLSVCALTSVAALAGEVKSDKVTLHRDVMVNGTLVKKGTYQVSYDKNSNELTIRDGKEVVAKATGQQQKRPRKPTWTEFVTAERSDNHHMISIAFAGDDQTIVLERAGN